MPSYKVSFAKIIGSPTATHWSQVYSAGNLYAVLSLAKKSEDKELSLSVAGKGILNNIEAEFFTLEEKSLSSIKEALKSAASSTPDEITISLTFGYLKHDVLYLFVIGNAGAVLRRDSKTAEIIKGGDEKKEKRAIRASSGYVRKDDRFLLHTHAFAALVSEEEVAEALAMDPITEAEEELTPRIHGKEAGDAAAVLMHLTATAAEPAGDTPSEELTIEQAATSELSHLEKAGEQAEPANEQHQHQTIHASEHYEPEDAEDDTDLTPTHVQSRFSLPAIHLPKKRMLILLAAIIIALALGGSIYSAQQSREQQKTTNAYNEVHTEAMRDFEVGESLEALNKAVAQDNFLKAKQTLEANRGKFKEGTKERDDLEAFLARINEKLGGDTSQTVSAKEIPDTESPLLAVLKGSGVFSATAHENSIYSLTKGAIVRAGADGDNEEEVHENDSDWSDPAGLAAFGSNLYVLDRDEGVRKLVAGSDGYGVTNYFTGDAPDLSQAQDMAIDGSVWILLKDGAILKYTRGEKDAFNVSGLQTPLRNPTRIFTNEETETVYVLDSGNSRIVALEKNGTFKKAYITAPAAKAKGFTVNEGDNTIHILSDGKIYELSL